MWRAMVLLAIALSLAIMVFDLQPLQRYATSATLYWVGLRRGHYIPDPDAPADAPLPLEAQGWLLSPSAEAYLIVAFLAALQFFYNNTGSGDDPADPAAVMAVVESDHHQQQQQQARRPSSHKTVTFATVQEAEAEAVAVSGEGEEPELDDAVAAASAAAEAVDGADDDGSGSAGRIVHTESSASAVSSSDLSGPPPSPDFIDNTRALASGVTTLIEMLYNGKITGAEQEEEAMAAAAAAAAEPGQEPGLGPVADAEGEGRQAAATMADPSSEPISPSASPVAAAAATTTSAGLAASTSSQAQKQQRPSSPSQQQQQPPAPGLRRGSATGTNAASSRLPALRPRTLLGGVYHLLHRAVLALLSGGVAFSFELVVLLTIVAALCHADLVSLLYLVLFVLLVGLPRATLRRHWQPLIHALALLVLAEYMFILRLPPAISYESRAAARLLGSRQCSIFSQYTPAESRQGPYSYGQWFGLCITDDALVLLDFIVLVLAIIQHKRFKAGE
jgi:hypothetical protein